MLERAGLVAGLLVRLLVLLGGWLQAAVHEHLAADIVGREVVIRRPARVQRGRVRA